MGTFKIRKIRNHLYVIWTHDYQVFKRSTGIRIEDKYWDSVNHRVKKSHPNRESIQNLLDNALNELINATIEVTKRQQEISPYKIRQFYVSKSATNSLGFDQLFQEYQRIKSSRVAKGTLNNIQQSYAWSRSGMRRWAIAQSSILGTIISVELASFLLMER